MWSVVITNAFGFTVFMIAAIALPIAVMQLCGRLKPAILGTGQIQGRQYWEWLGKSGWTPTQQFGNIVSWFIILGSSPHLINRAFIVRDVKDIYKGCIGTLIAGTGCTFLLYLGFVGLVNIIPQGTVKPDYLAAHACLTVLPAWIGVIYLMGAFAAGYTTTNTQYITCSQGIARDIYQSLINPNASDQQVIRWTWLGILLVAIATAILGAVRPWLLIIAGPSPG